DVYLQLAYFIVPKLRLMLRGSYTDESYLKYSGLGDASISPIRANAPNGKRSYYEWAWTHPTASAGLRITLPYGLFLQLNAFYEHTWFRIPSDSGLREDATDPALAGLIRGTRGHGLFYLEDALLYDTRDDEVNTSSGQFHQLEMRFSPGGTHATPYRYGQTNL